MWDHKLVDALPCLLLLAVCSNAVAGVSESEKQFLPGPELVHGSSQVHSHICASTLLSESDPCAGPKAGGDCVLLSNTREEQRLRATVECQTASGRGCCSSDSHVVAFALRWQRS